MSRFVFCNVLALSLGCLLALPWVSAESVALGDTALGSVEQGSKKLGSSTATGGSRGAASLRIAPSLSIAPPSTMATQDDEDAGKQALPIRSFFGKVKSVTRGEKPDEVTGFSFSARGKTISVDVADLPPANMCKHEALELKKVPSGRVAYLLAKKQKETLNPETLKTFPAQIVSVNAFVVLNIAEWKPPALTAKQKKAGLSWLKGILYNGEHSSTLDGVNIQIGRTRKVVHIVKAYPKDLKKKQMLRVAGVPDNLKKPKNLSASEIWILTKEIPSKEYSPLLQ